MRRRKHFVHHLRVSLPQHSTLAIMTLPTLPLVASHHPTTFLERGVAVPFTSPLLAGARVRPADRGGIEVIVPNPSGGRGVYILPWSGICRLSRPTVHDSSLYLRITERQGITPGTIRTAARAVAAQGLAGQEAVEAAGVAEAGETRDRLATNFLLMVAAVRQIDPTGVVDEAEVMGRHPALQRRAKHSLEQIAPRLGRSAEAVFSDLEQLAGVLTPIGLEQQEPPARVPRLLAAISRFRVAAAQWAFENPDESGAQASVAATIAAVTITCAEATLAEARASARTITELLQEWVTAPEPVARRLARTEWLVDGWEQICALWENSTSNAARRAALMEITLMVPVLPREVASWLDQQIDTEATRNLPRLVLANIDWRTAMYFERVARNEHLRALAV
jgi:hypothetical protein